MPAPPKDTPITVSELAKYDGSDPSLPIYVAIKGDIFDVSNNRDAYGTKGKGYNCFAGKDASKALGKSSLNLEDCVADYSDLTEKELETLNQWHAFFAKKYDIVDDVMGPRRFVPGSESAAVPVPRSSSWYYDGQDARSPPFSSRD
ncbi:hypothetical protein VTP01DRAFT_4235 [Rhizomucor pusillus]|uniref:uncharacterized protein n=1 Tax=Rhizomucor pusillus TaxID=4840 RepID=UPI003742D2F8